MPTTGNKSKQDRRMPRRLVAVTDDPDLCDGLNRLADGRGVPLPDILPSAVLPDLSTEIDRRTELLLLDVEQVDDPLSATAAAVSDTRARVVVFGRQNDVSLFRALSDAGAADYLLKPIDDTDLKEAIWVGDQAAPLLANPAEEAAPRVNLVMGARGGVGASTLAVCMAWWVAERLGQQTGLVDLDLSFGTTALSLDLLPGRGLRDALENPSRIDPLFVGSAMVNATDALFVLAAEDPLEAPISIEPQALTALVDALKETFPSLIIDVPRTLVPAAGELIDCADTATVMTELTLSGLRDAIRVRDYLRERDSAPAISVVASLPEAGRPALDRREFERGLEGAIDWMLPRAPKQMARAASDGVPLVSHLPKRHAYVTAVADLAGRCVSSTESKTKRRRLWPW